METFLNTFEDMDWLWTTHLKKHTILRLYYRSAIIYGNEDCPSKIELFKKQDPHYKAKSLTFTLDENGEYKKGEFV